MTSSDKTLAEMAHEHGFSSVREIEVVSGASVRNMYNWREQKPKLLRCVLLGAAHIKKNG